MLGAGGASKVLSTLRALARDAVSCLVLFDSDLAGAKERSKVVDSGLINVKDIFSVPLRQGFVETEFEDAFDPNLYIEKVSEACGINISGGEFQKEQLRSGDKNILMKRWSDVLESIVERHGKKWHDMSIHAKTAFGSALVENAKNVNLRKVPFIRSMSHQVLKYLNEKS